MLSLFEDFLKNLEAESAFPFQRICLATPFQQCFVYGSMLSGGICSLLQNTYRWLLCHCIIITPGCRHMQAWQCMHGLQGTLLLPSRYPISSFYNIIIFLHSSLQLCTCMQTNSQISKSDLEGAMAREIKDVEFSISVPTCHYPSFDWRTAAWHCMDAGRLYTRHNIFVPCSYQHVSNHITSC